MDAAIRAERSAKNGRRVEALFAESIVRIVILAIVERKIAFMGWNCRMGGAKGLRHGVWIPRCGHVSDGNVSDDVRVGDDVTVESVCMLDAVVFERAINDGGLIGSERSPHAAFELQIADVIIHRV